MSRILRNSFVVLALTLSVGANAQNEYCDSLYDAVQLEKEPTYGNGGSDVLRLFNEDLLEIIFEDHNEEPPTSFRMKLIINDKDEVVAISEIPGDYSEEVQAKLLAKLQEKGNWKSGSIGNKKVCSDYYFVVSCIMWE